MDRPSIDLERDAVRFLATQALISREVEWASNYFTTGVWTGSSTGSDIVGQSADTTDQPLVWDDANSDPINDVAYQARAMHLKTGKRPNTLVLGRDVWDKLRQHPDLVELIKYSSTPDRPSLVNRNTIAQVFEVERVLVADGIQTTSKENPSFETSGTTEFIAGKNALLAYVPSRPSVYEPSAGYTFNWQGYLGSSNTVVQRIPMPLKKSVRIEGEMAYAQKVTAPTLGVFFSNIIR